MSLPQPSTGTPIRTSIPSLMTQDFANDLSSDLSLQSHQVPCDETRYNAVVLTARTRSRAQARSQAREIETLRTCLQEERTAHAVQLAGAEHARRAVQCMRECVESLLTFSQQPCLALSRGGSIVQWNPSLAQSTGVSAEEAIGKPIGSLLAPDFYLPVCSMMARLLQPAQAMSPCPAETFFGPLSVSHNLSAASVTVVPVYHIPGCPEAVIVLITKKDVIHQEDAITLQSNLSP